MCDTFVALPSVTRDGSMIFGKNSDREVSEVQLLEHHPECRHDPDEMVECTYISIPQVEETQAILISRPFWMWGAEIGANEQGVVIGNEAVWTKMPFQKEGGLTGMDLLRLALERRSTARGALDTITELLEKYGQGGNGGYRNKAFYYHNSFLIADPNEAWVLETAGHLWVAKKVEDYYAISNGLTIGSDFDLMHEDLIYHAMEQGWVKKKADFHFANCYSDKFYTTFSACKARRGRAHELLRQKSYSLTDAFDHLRDHGHNDYRPDTHFLMDQVCAHAGASPARQAAQTTASLVAHLTPGQRTYWATATASPCTSIFKPVWFGENPLPTSFIGEQVDLFDDDIFWWHHEELHRHILQDFQHRHELVRKEFDTLEQRWRKEAAVVNDKGQATLTAEAFDLEREIADALIAMLETETVQLKPRFPYRHFWNKQNKLVGLK
ncbi:MAG: C69 family dipeptidase [Candidatus Marinimicrobia bacterium]|nr:C69 family dipeptidase [Candidatus Neomarinimicrobiota bacterium]